MLRPFIALVSLLGVVSWVGTLKPTAAQGTPMPYVKIQFFDNNGDPCNGCLLNAYSAGTTTRLSTYSDRALTTANANPVVLDSAGRATVYLSATSYRFVLTNSSGGTTYWDTDNIPAVPVTDTALDVSGTAGEALAAGEVVYLSDGCSGATTAGRWWRADADATCASTFAGTLGVAVTAIGATASGTIRLQGRVTGLSGLTAGLPFYVSATSGALTTSILTNSRFVGTAETSSTLVLAPNPNIANILQRTLRVNASTPYALALPTADALGALVSDGAGVVTFSAPPLALAEGRLTATTAVPVTTADVTAATSIYYTPYKGNRIALFDGTATWTARAFTEITISVAACTASKPYDVFLYNNSGTVAAETLVWTNDTTRATALVAQNGVLVKTGATTRRYVGSFYCNSSGGQTDDSLAKRNVWNYDNRVHRPLRVTEATDSWQYMTATLRQARATATNQLEVMVGVAEDVFEASVSVSVANTIAGTFLAVAIGEDSTTTAATGSIKSFVGASTQIDNLLVTLRTVPAAGRHTYVWLEYSAAAGTSTWYGDAGSPDVSQSGITGTVIG